MMYGAETEELDRIAGELRCVADELDAGAKGLTSVVTNLAWFGEAAAGWLSNWTGVKVPQLHLSTDFLRGAAVKLEAQAREQREASRQSGDEYIKDPARYLNNKIAERLDSRLSAMVNASASEQLSWWNGLTDQQRTALLHARPHIVAELQGLPTEVRERARDIWTEDVVRSSVVVTRGMVGAELSLQGKLLNGVFGSEFEFAKMSDGSYVLTYTGKAGVGSGGQLPTVSTGGEGPLSILDGLRLEGEASIQPGLSLKFETEDALHQFVYDGIEAVEGGPSILRHARLAEFVNNHAAQVEALSLGGEAKVQAGDLSAAVSVGHEVNLKDVTYTASGRVTVEAGPGSVGAAASVVSDAAGPRFVKLQLDGRTPYLGVALERFGGDGQAATAAITTGGFGQAEVTFDLRDPALRGEAGNMLAAVATGNPGSVLEHGLAAADRAQVVVTTGTADTGSFTADIGIAGIDTRSEFDQTTHVFVKLPGGDLTRVPNHVVDGGSTPSTNSIPSGVRARRDLL